MLVSTSVSNLETIESTFYKALDLNDEELTNKSLDLIKEIVPDSSVRLGKLVSELEESVGNGSKAAQSYKELLTKDPTHLATRKRLIATSLYGKGDAIQQLEVHLDTFASDVESWLLIARLYTADGKYSQAIYSYEQVLLLQPRDPVIMVRLAECWYAINRAGLSIKYFCGALESIDYYRAWWGLYVVCRAVVKDGLKDADVDKDVAEALMEMAAGKINV